MEIAGATEPLIQEEFSPLGEQEEETITASSPPETTGGHLEQLQDEEKLRIAEVEKDEKSAAIQSDLETLLTLIKLGSGDEYPEWAENFHQIIQRTERRCYEDNRELFTIVLDYLMHPPADTPAIVYIPLLWNIGLDLLWLDFSKCREIEREYFFATFQIPNLILKANKEFELGNIDEALALIEQIKGFVEMHYSNIPILADRREHEKAAYILSIAKLEMKIDPDKAIKTLTNFIKPLSQSMDVVTFFKKWGLVLFILYVSRRAIFG